MKSIVDVITQAKSYFASNEAFTNEVATRAANGAHNLLPNIATSQVINGVTFTVNSDGSVTANVPANPNAATLSLTTTLKLPAGTYKLTGCPSGGSTTRYYMQGAGDVDYTTGSAILDTGEGFTFTLTATNTLLFNILIRTGFTEGGTITFYPIIRLASDTDPTYTPYAKTNRELTKDTTSENFTLQFSNASANASFAVSFCKKVGNILFVSSQITTGNSAISAGSNVADITLSNVSIFTVVGSGGTGSAGIYPIDFGANRFILKLIGDSLPANDTVTVDLIMLMQ